MEKRIYFCLDEIKKIKLAGIKFHYTIIADGNDLENINFQIEDLDLKNYVTLINGLYHKEVLNKILNSNIFLLPSLEEGVSNAVLEAMALKTFVISTDCGGMGEVIDNNINGILISTRETNAIKEAIITYLNMSIKKKNEITNNAYQRIKSNFILKSQIEKMNYLYKKLM